MQQSAPLLTADQLRALPLFATLAPEAASAVVSQARGVEVPRGELLVRRGQRLDGMYTVLEGTLKIYLLSCNGDERVIRVVQPGDCFGEAIMFNAIPSPVFVQVLTRAHVCFLPRDAVYDALRRQPEFTFGMLQALSHLLQELIGDLEACCTQNARQRVAHYLLQQARGARRAQRVVLPASKMVVASTLSLSAETFSRELHGLARDGIIRVQRRTILLLDKEGLTACAHQGRTK
jgi:CRP/FNR family transcriptional regulator, dissimilatory nitrate respiration regulator